VKIVDDEKLEATQNRAINGLDMFVFETDDQIKIICVLQPDMTPLVSTFQFVQAALHLTNPLNNNEKTTLNNALARYQDTQRTPVLNQIFCKDMPLDQFSSVKELLGDSEVLQTTRYPGLGALLDFVVSERLFTDLDKRPSPTKMGTNWLPELILVTTIRRMITLSSYRQSYWQKAPIQQRLLEDPKLMLPVLTQLVEKQSDQNELQKTLADLQAHLEKATALLQK
jgi:hypothetical protein